MIHSLPWEIVPTSFLVSTFLSLKIRPWSLRSAHIFILLTHWNFSQKTKGYINITTSRYKKKGTSWLIEAILSFPEVFHWFKKQLSHTSPKRFSDLHSKYVFAQKRRSPLLAQYALSLLLRQKALSFLAQDALSQNFPSMPHPPQEGKRKNLSTMTKILACWSIFLEGSRLQAHTGHGLTFGSWILGLWSIELIAL